MSYNNPTVGVALAHIEAQGVSTEGCIEALNALHAAPQPHDGDALERLIIMGTEHLQRALLVAQSGTLQTVAFAPPLLDAAIIAVHELAILMGVNHG